jgi:hypothetical protein
MLARERRTPAEFLAANDELTRLMLLQVTCERARRCSVGSRPLDEPAETPKHSNSGGRDPAGQKAR